MTILKRGGLEIADGRKIAGGESTEEVAEIVLMIRLVCLSHRSKWGQVMRVARTLKILKRLVVRNVIRNRCAGNVLVAGRASRRTGRDRRRFEPALEPSPGN